MRPSLRHYIAVAFIFAATIPVIFLGLWLQRSATENEFMGVYEKHYLLARNIENALQQYAVDLTSTFDLFVRTSESGNGTKTFGALASGLKIRGFSIYEGARQSYEIAGTDGAAYRLPPATLAKIPADPSSKEIVFHGVISDHSNRPTLFMTQQLSGDRLAVATVGTEFFDALRSGIKFGHQGHAAIVDQHGRLISHPDPEWTMRDISGLEPIRRIQAGTNGTARFYSPAYQTDMIAGFAAVPLTGWGILVPQPASEFLIPGENIQQLVIIFVIIGLFAAGILGWLLSKVVAHQIERIIDIALDYAEGDRQSTSHTPTGRYTPVELRQLTTGLRVLGERKTTTVAPGYGRQANDDWPDDKRRTPANTP